MKIILILVVIGVASASPQRGSYGRPITGSRYDQQGAETPDQSNLAAPSQGGVAPQATGERFGSSVPVQGFGNNQGFGGNPGFGGNQGFGGNPGFGIFGFSNQGFPGAGFPNDKGFQRISPNEFNRQ